MPNEDSTSRNALAAAIFILLAAMLVCPGMLLCVPDWSFRFFETGTIVLVAAGTALLFPKKVLSVRNHLPHGLVITAVVLFFIGLWHGIRHAGQYNAAETGELFLTAALPFCVCVFANEFRRLLPRYLALFWLIDVVLGFIQYYALHWFLFGLPQNINWNAAFLAVTAPFAVLTVREMVRKPVMRLTVSILIAGVTLWQIVLTESRGAALGILSAGALWLFLRLGRRGRQKALFATLALTIAASLWFAFAAQHDRIMEKLSRDERIFLAHTTLDMIADSPNLGFGAPSFEQEYLRFRSPEFFSMRHSAVRVDHPHNHPLYIAASFGIPGLICWLYLLLEPMIFASRRFDRLTPETKLSLLCLAGLLVHAQFDLVLFRWPTNIFAMFFLGLLLHEREGSPAPFWRPPAFLRRFRLEFLMKFQRSRAPGRQLGRLFRPALFALGVVILGAGLFSAFSNLAAETLAWHADTAEDRGDHCRASRLYLMAASMPGSSLSLKSRALLHASIHDTEHAGHYYALFAASSTPDFGYSNDYFARACVIGGHPADAVPFLKRAMNLRPRSVLPLIMLADVYDRLGSRGAADAVRERLERLMTYRRLHAEDLETILKNEELDLHAWFKRDPVLMKENNL